MKQERVKNITPYIYTIEDKVAENAGPVFTAVNDGVAKRQFENMLGDNRHKEDFVLWRVAQFDMEKVEIINITKSVVCTGLEIIHKEEKCQ